MCGFEVSIVVHGGAQSGGKRKGAKREGCRRRTAIGERRGKGRRGRKAVALRTYVLPFHLRLIDTEAETVAAHFQGEIPIIVSSKKRTVWNSIRTG